MFRGLPLLRIKLEYIVAVAVLGGFNLLQHVLVTEQPEVTFHRRPVYDVSPSNSPRRISIKIAE